MLARSSQKTQATKACSASMIWFDGLISIKLKRLLVWSKRVFFRQMRNRQLLRARSAQVAMQGKIAKPRHPCEQTGHGRAICADGQRGSGNTALANREGNAGHDSRLGDR